MKGSKRDSSQLTFFFKDGLAILKYCPLKIASSFSSFVIGLESRNLS